MPDASPSIGRLSPGAINTDLIEQTIGFIWDSLIPWRSAPGRTSSAGEEDLNGDFHDFLSARAAECFPMVFFRHEQRQEGRRRVDLSVKPLRPTTIRGMLYSWNDAFLVIEGKRLPAPSRDREREYVTGGEKHSGGIQRFKLGLHGKDHETAILLGYMQEGTLQEWHLRISDWISELIGSHPETWSGREGLSELELSDGAIRARCHSVHTRPASYKQRDIQLRHFWIHCHPDP